MSNYHYIQSEPGLWTVGTGTPSKGGDWEPESDHTSPAEAAARVNFLNGGGSLYETDSNVMHETLQKIAFMNSLLDDEQMEHQHGTIAMLMRRAAREALAKVS